MALWCRGSHPPGPIPTTGTVRPVPRYPADCPARDEYHGEVRYPRMATTPRTATVDPTVLLVARRHVDFGRLSSALCRAGR